MAPVMLGPGGQEMIMGAPVGIPVEMGVENVEAYAFKVNIDHSN